MGKIMSRFRIIIKLSLFLIALVIIAPIVFIATINPNNYKGQISSFISSKLDRQVEINGDIKAHFWPWAGLEAQKVAIKEPQGFDGYMATIESLGLKISLPALIKWRFDIDSLQLSNLNINFTRKEDGSTNWDNFATSNNDTKNNDSTKIDGASKETSKINYSIATVNIDNGTINYVDKKANTKLTIKNLSVIGKKALFKLPLDGKFTAIYEANNKIEWQVDSSFNGDVNFKENKEIIIDAKSVDLNIQKNQKEILAQIGSIIHINPDFDISCKNLQLNMMNHQFLGWIDIPFNPKKDIKFSLSAPRLNANKFTFLAKVLGNDFKNTVGVSEQDNYDTPQIIRVAYKDKPYRTIAGDLKIKHVMWDKFDLYNFNTNVKLTKDGARLAPLTANAYQGSVNLAVFKPWEPSAPISIDGKVSNMEVKNILTDLHGKQNITGKLNADLDISLSPRGNLNGRIQANVNNGILYGMDVRYYIAQAESLAKREPVLEKNDNLTRFGTISGTFIANNNILSNNDLRMNGPEFVGSGRGTINLNNQTLNYRLEARKQYNDGGDHSNAIPLVVSVTGPISNPKITPDIDAYVKIILEREIKDRVGQEIDKKLDKLIGGDGERGSGNNPIEKELNKNIKKIFGF